jgi:hypothetical protein
MNIVFFPVKDTPSKLSKLCKIAAQHMSQKEPLLFLVPDKAAFDFLDKLHGAPIFPFRLQSPSFRFGRSPQDRL